MDDTTTLREILRYASGALETAEKFYDASAVMILTEIISIIEEGGHIADAFPVGYSTRNSG